MSAIRTLAAIGLASAVAIVANPIAPAQDVLLLKDGRSIQGRVIAEDPDSVTVSLALDGPGRAVQVIAYADLHPRTVYRLRLGRPEARTAKGQLDLAELALAQGLFEASRRHFARAGALDTACEDAATDGIARVRRSAAESLLGRARELAAANAPLDASKELGRLLQDYPDEAAAEEGRKLFSTLAPAREEAERKRVAEATARADEERREAVSPAAAAHARGVKHVTLGLLATKNHAVAVQHFKDALRACEQGLATLRKLAQERPADTALAGIVASMDTRITAHLVETDLHLASLYLVRQTPREALAWANRALALDPENREALAMRARIETAALGSGRFAYAKRLAR